MENNASNALKKISAFAAARDNSELQKRTMMLNEIKEYEKKISGLKDKILELKEIVNELGKNRIRNGIFFIDGITHCLGFNSDNYIKYDPYSDAQSIALPNSQFGIRGGGCCGEDLFLNLDSGQIEFQGEEKDYHWKLQRFVEEFDNYEKKVYEYVEKL